MDTSELELADAGSWLVTITDTSQGHEYLSFELIIAAGCTHEDPSTGITPNVQFSQESYIWPLQSFEWAQFHQPSKWWSTLPKISDEEC